MGNVLVNELTGTQAEEDMPKAKSVTSFEFNSPDIHDRFAVVVLYAFDKAVWQELNNPNEPPVGSVIMEDAATNTIYAASLPQDSVFDPDTAKGKLFQSLVMSLDDVKKAFVLVKR